MKCKLYFQMFVALMMATFTFAGCDNTPVDDGPKNPITFELEVSSVKIATATVAVTPSDIEATYYCGAMEKSVYDAFATEEVFFAAEIKRLEAIATENHISLKEYLGLYVGKGKSKQFVTMKSPKTVYYAYVFGINIDGKITSKLFKSSEFTSGEAIAPVVKPVVKPELWAGDGAGANKSSVLSFKISVTESPAVSGKYYFAKTADVDKAIADGATLESLVSASPNAFAPVMITAMNSAEGMTGYEFNKLVANTDYTLIAMVVDAQGTIGIGSVKASTEVASGGGGDVGPTVTLTLKTGLYPSGGDPEKQVNLIIESDPMNVTAGKNILAETAEINKIMADEGLTYEELVAQAGTVLTAERIKIINDGGLVLNYNPTLEPGTSYTAIVSLTNPTGTSLAIASVTTAGGSGGGDEGPLTFTFAVTEITATAAKIQVTPSNMTAPYFFDYMKSSSLSGLSDVQIVSIYADLAAKYPSVGIAGYNPSSFVDYPIEPDTEYTVLAFGFADGAATTGVSKSTFKTLAGGGGGDVTPTDAYKAWLGTWTVASATSEISKKSLSFDVTFAQKVANTSYSVLGWSITALRTDATLDFTAKFNNDGGMSIKNEQAIGSVTGGVLNYVSRALDPVDGKTYIAQGGFDGFTGVMDASKTSATVTSPEVTFSGDNYACKVTSMDYFNIKTAGGVSGYVAAEGFTNGDYPVGPYTMTKKSSATVSAKSSGVNIKSLLSHTTVLAKTAVATIPVLSSVMKQMSYKAFEGNGLNNKLQNIKINAKAQPMALKPVTYEMVLAK